MENIVFYHDDIDGFTAAWAAWKKLGGESTVYFPVDYGMTSSPGVAGKTVFILDFSFPREVLIDLGIKARGVVLLDHHETAEENLRSLIGSHEPGADNIFVHFDKNHSGAWLAWEYFHTNDPVPNLIKYVEDADLWRWKLQGSKQINIYMKSWDFDFNDWDEMAKDMEGPAWGSQMAWTGANILRKHMKDVRDLVRVAIRREVIGGHEVPVANMPPHMASDAGYFLCEGVPFAATYFDTPAGRKFQLRSNAEGMNVAKIAEIYGGGGHEHAAGFTLPFDTGL